MNITKRILPALALLLLLSSCGDAAATPVTTQAVTEAQTGGETVETAEPDPTAIYDPKLDAVDFGGDVFNIIYGDNDFEPNLDVCASETNGEPLNDAIFNRNLAIKEKYNVDITWERFGYGDASSKLIQSVKAGDDVYDMTINNGVYSFQLATQGYSLQLDEVPYLDFSKPYWNDGMLDGASINGRNYFVYSDINIHALGATPCVLFNKPVAEQHDIDDLYQLVVDGKWTFDKMTEYIKMITRDLDGDGKITELDMHGFIGNTFVIDCFLSGTGYQTITKDADDLPILNIQSEEYYNIVGAIQNICSEETGSFICDRYNGVDREYAPMDALEQDRALFWIANLKGVERMRNMESAFGILPIPKLNEAQKDYKIHYQANIGGAMSVPVTVSNPDMVGMILEDMSYLSMRDVKPAYIDVLLQGKFLRDEESLVTLEIMFDSYYSDIGFMTGSSGVTILDDLRSFVKDNRSDYVSRIEKKLKKFDKLIENIIEKYQEEIE
ncbi:MAG: extracellular solute-binding protein [Clostridia bacterium]|nr:extracellular solute-binding protein [Clostridia bacterium]